MKDAIALFCQRIKCASACLKITQKGLAAIEGNVDSTGVTVGPTAPPATFAPHNFLQTVQAYKEACVTYGWITNAGIANSLDVKLNAALAALKAGNNNEATNQLNTFLNKVSAQSGKHLSPEAVELLQTNTQYLLSHM